jgi:hypothetical protein
MTTRKRPEELRSHRWLGVSDLRSFACAAALVSLKDTIDVDWYLKSIL